MRWRSFILLALLVSEGSFAAASAQPQVIDGGLAEDSQSATRVVHVHVPDPLIPASTTATMETPDRSADEPVSGDVPGSPALLKTVSWTVPEPMKVETLAQKWGLREAKLRELNPQLEGRATVQPGDELVVFTWQSDQTTESIGAPHRGRLAHGIPMPEGTPWRLRDRRIRAYGAVGTVRSLVQAFTAYGEIHPDGPPIHVGELSYRKGGRAWPHRSHRTGRDVDIGYIMQPGVLGERHWARADEKTLDVERTWTLIKALGETGRVQRMFISSRLQKVLKKYARTVETDEVLGQYFRTPGAGPAQRYLITHENGHRDHLHVRFRCDAADRRCRGRGPFPIEPAPASIGASLSTAAP